MVYEEIHKYILTTMMSRGVMLQSELEKVFISYSEDVDLKLKDIITEINVKIRRFKQQIKTTTNEVTGFREFVFIFMSDDECARSQNLFSQNDLEYFKHLLEEIILSENKCIPGITAMNVSSKVKTQSFSKTRAQELLDTWTSLRYLAKDLNNCYSIDSRTVQEFETYIQHCFPDLLESCFLCKKPIVKSKCCIPCNVSYHFYCLETYTKKVKKWPCCKHEFKEDMTTTIVLDGPTFKTDLVCTDNSSDSDSEPVTSQTTSRKRKRNA